MVEDKVVEVEGKLLLGGRDQLYSEWRPQLGSLLTRLTYAPEF